ncbi:TPA: plasmid segregation protein ParM [Klebsiella pneumoniae]|uniref:Plasmid segregation protein n=3 Tax=Klebsiella pneumoniae complex TaxID=3390273 RepID=A0A7I8HSZ8_9ENTR|nr:MULTISPECIES: plasmid segregation protein ParM [Klebsiella/Raoultella group]HBK9423779.1 plasmid segregation protein ParM [Escherichia coli]EKJ7348220.1 plasmid segregation protein ParM [Klebsiella pneumoniae]EKW2176532.1 plasmid segregation protein ParM [Klebsiella pneumoniae]EKY1566258.1 plasmid segregation protein ParM [Klebsiella pneumoniae]ELA2927503.1 plasmid segregation protein ParM [Klebsiella variicola]
MVIFIDDGSTNVKLQWNEAGKVHQHISPNSFKREWAVSFGDNEVFNYTLNGEHYSFDPISPDAVVTTNVAWQYSDLNVVSVQHALQTSGLSAGEIDIVCTLPLTEYYGRDNQPNAENIERKKNNLKRGITLNDGVVFTIKDVKVMPESIPAGYEVLQQLNELDSLLIIDLGGTTLDVSQVMGKLSGISKIQGDPSLGVSIVTSAVKDALSVARTKGSSFLADEIIIHRRDQDYLKKRINDEYKIPMVLNAMNDEIKKLINRVLNVIDSFTGYTHVMVIGGGAELISDAVQKHTNIRKDRFFKTETSQFDLVNGMYLIGN